MTILAFICFCLVCFHAWLGKRRVAKHDGILFPFCQLRRDIMKFLFENVAEKTGALSHAEYKSVRRLATALDQTIHNYNRHKTTLFNLRYVVKLLHQYRHTLKHAEPINMTANKKIRLFHQRFAWLLAKAFIAYTPLIRSEIVVRLLGFASVRFWRVSKLRVTYATRVAADIVNEYKHGRGRSVLAMAA